MEEITKEQTDGERNIYLYYIYIYNVYAYI